MLVIDFVMPIIDYFVLELDFTLAEVDDMLKEIIWSVDNYVVEYFGHACFDVVNEFFLAGFLVTFAFIALILKEPPDAF